MQILKVDGPCESQPHPVTLRKVTTGRELESSKPNPFAKSSMTDPTGKATAARMRNADDSSGPKRTRRAEQRDERDETPLRSVVVRRKNHPHDDVVRDGLGSVLPSIPLELVQDYALNRQYWYKEANILKIAEGVSPVNVILDFNLSPDSTTLVMAVKNGMVAYAVSSSENNTVEKSCLLWQQGGNSDNRYDSYGFSLHPDGEVYAFLFDAECDLRSANS